MIKAYVLTKRVNKTGANEPDLPFIEGMGAVDVTAQMALDINDGKHPVTIWEVNIPDDRLSTLQAHAGCVIVSFEQLSDKYERLGGNKEGKLSIAQRNQLRAWLQESDSKINVDVLNQIDTTKSRQEIVETLIDSVGNRKAGKPVNVVEVKPK